jgi:hypothetical protein
MQRNLTCTVHTPWCGLAMLLGVASCVVLTLGAGARAADRLWLLGLPVSIEFYEHIEATSDGGFLGVGLRLANPGLPSGSSSDQWVVKHRGDNSVEWERTLGFAQPNEEALHAIELSKPLGGGFVVVGRTAATDGLGLTLTRLTDNGTLVWARRLPGRPFATTASYDAAVVRELSNGRLLVVGDRDGAAAAPSPQGVLHVVDAVSGAPILSRAYAFVGGTTGVEGFTDAIVLPGGSLAVVVGAARLQGDQNPQSPDGTGIVPMAMLVDAATLLPIWANAYGSAPSATLAFVEEWFLGIDIDVANSKVFVSGDGFATDDTGTPNPLNGALGARIDTFSGALDWYTRCPELSTPTTAIRNDLGDPFYALNYSFGDGGLESVLLGLDRNTGLTTTQFRYSNVAQPPANVPNYFVSNTLAYRPDASGLAWLPGGKGVSFTPPGALEDAAFVRADPDGSAECLTEPSSFTFTPIERPTVTLDIAAIQLPPSVEWQPPLGAPQNALRSIACPTTEPCNPADIADNGSIAGADGCVDNGDFSLFISEFFNAGVQSGCTGATIPCCASDIADNGSNPGADGFLDNGDFSLFIASFFNAQCPNCGV